MSEQGNAGGMTPGPIDRFLAGVVADFYPGYFALVMATGIVSIAAHFLGPSWVAWLLLGINLVAYLVLWTLTVLRVARFFPRVAADLTDHKRGPGYFTLVAGTGVLGRQFEFLTGSSGFPIVLWFLAVLLWVGLIYGFLTAITVRANKPLLASGLHGGWLLMVVATQSLSILGILVAHHFERWRELVLFFALATYLLGCVLYIVIISLIFYRFTFIPLVADALTPAYWINMGALAITTLAGATLILHAHEWNLIQELVPFLTGLTLVSWVTATWWIPLLLTLGAWRHVRRRVPLKYDPEYWALVFPMGMYTVCTYQLSATPGLDFLSPICRYFVYVAYLAWAVVFLGLVHRLVGRLAGRAAAPRVFDTEAHIVAINHAELPPPPSSASFLVVCPVHGVEAQVQLSGLGGNEAAALNECSLHPGHPGGPPCEGRCIMLGAEAVSQARVPGVVHEGQ